MCSMFHDYCCKYSPFICPLFVGVGKEVNERPEFTTCPSNGGFECIEMDVGAYGRMIQKYSLK